MHRICDRFYICCNDIEEQVYAIKIVNKESVQKPRASAECPGRSALVGALLQGIRVVRNMLRFPVATMRFEIMGSSTRSS